MAQSVDKSSKMGIMVLENKYRAGLKFPRSTAAGVFLANFFMMEKVLSIFIDESGDFGRFDRRAPYYLVTMLFHDQSDDISGEITVFILRRLSAGREYIAFGRSTNANGY